MAGRLEPENRPCVWCGAAYFGPAFPDPDHLPDCPSVTNLWPIRAEDLAHGGICCPGCGVEFRVGDLTVERLLTEREGLKVVMAVCLDCAFWERPIPNLPPSLR